MPIYEYVCKSCGLRFEEQRDSDARNEPADCPQGHARAGARDFRAGFFALRLGTGSHEPEAADISPGGDLLHISDERPQSAAIRIEGSFGDLISDTSVYGPGMGVSVDTHSTDMDIRNLRRHSRPEH